MPEIPRPLLLDILRCLARNIVRVLGAEQTPPAWATEYAPHEGYWPAWTDEVKDCTERGMAWLDPFAEERTSNLFTTWRALREIWRDSA